MGKTIPYVFIILFVLGISYVSYKMLFSVNDPHNSITIGSKSSNKSGESVSQNSSTLIKSLPIEIKKYDQITNRAGDMNFAKNIFTFDRPYVDYGFTIPASPDYPAKINPQPLFIVPLGIKVRAIIDGVVVDISKLYSGDYTILLAENENPQMFFEVEHINNVMVKKGDKVKAGDIIAQVSSFGVGDAKGYGMVEIGVFKPGNPPTHLCPYLYLDPDYKEEILQTLTTLYNDWNTYMGKILYDFGSYESAGCVTRSEIPN